MVSEVADHDGTAKGAEVVMLRRPLKKNNSQTCLENVGITRLLFSKNLLQ